MEKLPMRLRLKLREVFIGAPTKHPKSIGYVFCERYPHAPFRLEDYRRIGIEIAVVSWKVID